MIRRRRLPSRNQPVYPHQLEVKETLPPLGTSDSDSVFLQINLTIQAEQDQDQKSSSVTFFMVFFLLLLHHSPGSLDQCTLNQA